MATTRRGVCGVCGAWVVAALVAGSAAPATARSIEIDDFAVDLRVDESAGLAVTETIRLRFDGRWNGIIRAIPTRNVTSRGEHRNLGFRLESVTDESGNRLETTRSRRGADVDLKIRVPGAVDAVRTVVIRYRITGGLRFFDDHDELYWNVTGDEWTFPIHAARARITLPRRLVNVRANGFAGPHGSRERSVRIVVDGAVRPPDDAVVPAGESPPPEGEEHVIEIEATRPLGIREGLTAAVAWNPGVIARPSAWRLALGAWSAWLTEQSPIFLVPLLAFLGMLWRWWCVGRDPRSGPLVVEYGPPDGLGPAEAGALVDNRPDSRDIVAGLVDAAVKGVVRIRETSPSGWFTRATYAFDLLVPESRWEAAGISPAGCRTLRGMFESPDDEAGADGVIRTVTSVELDRSFHANLSGIRDAIFADLIGRGLYRTRPDNAAVPYLILAALVGLPVWVGGTLWLREDGIAPMIAGIVTMLIIGGFALVMPARTTAGARARDRVRGFQEFLRRVEAHRLESLPLTPELFEKFLPYAIALGVERRWAKAFEGICTSPPTWFAGSTIGHGVDFDVGGFTDRIDAMGVATAAVMTSVPRSSGDSAFGGGNWGGSGSGGGDWGGGGGGFSGGGDGGGGGSGW